MKSYAKINIGLNILNKREDGYHNLETIFAPVDISDEILINDESRHIEIVTKSKHIPSDDRNICYKSAKKLLDFAGIRKGVIIEIRKKIPVGAGLGGGSSNAAAVLNELIKYFDIKISKEDLSRIALDLGSDVPYFLGEGLAYALGRGEILDYFDIEIPYWILSIFPSVSVSTKWAYEAYKEKDNPILLNLKEYLVENIQKPEKLRSGLINDFEEIVFKRYAGLMNIKNELYEKGAVYASLSGSGSSLYGFFDSFENIENAFNLFISRYKTFITNPGFKIQ
jgi:4-diphosphocytidyl-2-C-methyl-D-erythritol kinase